VILKVKQKEAVMRTTLGIKVLARVITLLMMATLLAPRSFGYGTFTHEAIIEYSWKRSIVPVLLKRFPTATEDQLREARSYAYGGAIIQDMGYFPFLNGFFSDLLHYVRSGDFIEELIRESSDLNEYAFALGALEHYAADNTGHPIATNRAVPIYYPKLRAKYGDVVTYEQNKAAHSQTELGFDVVEVAAKAYRGEIYSELILFEVPKPLLARAFKKTYGIELRKLFRGDDLDWAIRRYQRTLMKDIPLLTSVAWKIKRDEIIKQNPQITDRDFVYKQTIPKQRRMAVGRYSEPLNIFECILAFFVGVFVKLGLIKPLDYRVPAKETEKLFRDSLLAAQHLYEKLLREVEDDKLKLENMNYDTGQPTRPGEYRLADEAYAELLEKLAKEDFRGVTPELRANILAFYADTNLPIATKKDKSKWKATMRALRTLKTVVVVR
jgi:hypothetical protein